MKKLLLGSVALVALAAAPPAGAADMPAYKAPVVRETLCDYNRFNGKYIGANVGWLQYNAYQQDSDRFFNGKDFAQARSDDGWAGGAQAGWNWQKHCTVFGVEIDWSWTNAKYDSVFQPNREAGILEESSHSRLNWFGTARAKSGLVLDNLLLYVTGGLAWARFTNSQHNSVPVASFIDELGWNDTKWGWTVGAGIEYALTPKISIKSEALFMSFPEKEYRLVEHNSFGVPNRCISETGPSGICTFRSSEQVWVSRIGINFKFDDAIYARY